jgi:hypothetical protein
MTARSGRLIPTHIIGIPRLIVNGGLRGHEKGAGLAARRLPIPDWASSDGVTDGRQDAVDLAAEERHRGDRENGNKRQDECVLGEALTAIVASDEAEQVLEHLV